MKEALIRDINGYIAYLNSTGLLVSVHGRRIGGLLEHNVHTNLFCALVKTQPEAWEKCIRCQQKVFKERGRECLFGMCHAGVEEYVFFAGDGIFVSVSGYGLQRERAAERMGRLARECYLDQKKLLQAYDSCLKHEKENEEELAARIKPLCHMLSLLQMGLADRPEPQTQNATVASLLAFVQNHYTQALTLREIAQGCACSESTVCHLFKQYTGRSVKQYISELRMEQAGKLLRTSHLPVSTLARMCGFSNVNYFPTAFKKHTGRTPTEYRRQTQAE